MKIVWSGASALLLAAAGLVHAQSCDCTCPVPPITLFRQPPPPPACQGPALTWPPPVIYRAEVAPPERCEAPPPAPIHLFRLPLPPIETRPFTPPAIKLCRAEIHPPLYAEAPGRAPITLFARTPEEVQYGPPKTLPPVTLYCRPQPPSPCQLGCVGGHAAGPEFLGTSTGYDSHP